MPFEWLLEWGVEVIHWLQLASPMLDLPGQAVTYLGSEGFFFLMIPLVYWSVDRNLGARLIPLFLLSVYVTLGLKQWVGQPRPFQYDSTVAKLAPATTESFPSGHTQQTVVLWGFLATSVRRKWLYCLAAALMVVVPLSRLYLGVHFPHDLLGGYVLGFGLIWLYGRFEPVVACRVRRVSPGWRLALVLAVCLALSMTVRTAYGITGPAVLAGVWTGEILERRWVGFETDGSWQQRAFRYLVGMALVAVVYAGLSLVQAKVDALPLVLRWIKYATVGLTATLVAPWVFVRVGLAGVEESPTG